MILTIEVVKRNNNLGSAIGRCGAHRRKLRTSFWHVYYFFIGITSIELFSNFQILSYSLSTHLRKDNNIWGDKTLRQCQR
jgi:hypothetical protein